MIYPALTQVEAYWNGLRNGRPVPARAEIDPRGMNEALEYAFILERIATGIARFRLAGMHLSDLMGMEVRGMPLTSMFVPESRGELSEALEAVFETPQLTRISLRGERGVGRAALDAELLLCPLKSDLGDVNRALGCLQSRGDIGRQPRRFQIVDIATSPIVSDTPAVSTPKPGSSIPAKTPVPPGFAEAKAAYEAQSKDTGPKTPTISITEGRDGKPRPALRLIKSDD